ncbi:hypothetical protein CR513_20223, partial [Mucuna pruriens]
MSPYRIIFGKACHLPEAQLQELEELRLEAYENSCIYKQREFQVDQKVLLFNSRSRITVELQDELTRNTFQANGKQLKIFHEGPTTIVDGEHLSNRTGHDGWHHLRPTLMASMP